MDLSTTIPWLRGRLSYTALADLQASTNRVYLVGRLSGVYYHLYLLNIDGINQLAWASVAFAATLPPVTVSLLDTAKGLQLLIGTPDLTPTSQYLSGSASSPMALNSSIGTIFRFSQTQYTLSNANSKALYSGVWYTVTVGGSVALWNYYAATGKSFAGSSSLVATSSMDITLLPVNGSFWTSGIYRAAGIRAAGCYSTLAYDTLKAFENSVTGNYTVDSPPANNLPITQCDRSTHGWLDSKYNFCVFTTATECSRGYWYSYGPQCGNDMGGCTVSSQECVSDYSVISTSASDQAPLSCTPKLAAPAKLSGFWSRLTTVQKRLVIGVLVGVGLFIGAFVFFFFNRSRSRANPSSSQGSTVVASSANRYSDLRSNYGPLVERSHR